jgi:hypothetical protein
MRASSLYEIEFPDLTEAATALLVRRIAGREVALPRLDCVAALPTGAPAAGLEDCGFQETSLLVMEYGTARYDVYLSFFLPAGQLSMSCETATRLWLYAKEVSAAAGVERFFAGHEPADDRDSQFFTQSGPGPLWRKGWPLPCFRSAP